MQIIINDAVKAYLNKKASNVLTVSLAHSGGG